MARLVTHQHSHPFRVNLGIGLVLLIAVLIVTWPLALHWKQTVGLGTEQEATVPLFNAWTLWWVADRAGHGFAHFWQAPIFFPSEGTFTFSEPQPLTGMLAFLASRWLPSPIAAYNGAILFCLWLNGVFGYRLGRAFQIPWWPALLGGLLFISLPVTQKFLGVLPLIPLFGVLWALEGFIRFGREGSWRTAIWTGIGLLVLLFTSQQLALLFVLFMFPAGLLALAQQHMSSGAVLKLGGVAMGVLLVAGWYAWYPITLHQSLDFTRSEHLVNLLSARFSDYLSKPISGSFPFPPREDLLSDTGGLFPGFVLIAMAGWGGIQGIKSSESYGWTWYAIGSGTMAFLLSLGTHSVLDGGMTLGFLRDWVPGFHELRSPFRFAIFVQIFLGLLGVLGIRHFYIHNTTSIHRIILGLIMVCGMAENLSVPQPLAHVPTSSPSPWTTWLSTHPERRILAHVPFPSGLHVSDYQIETTRMLAQTIHHKPLINGYSGFFPPGYIQFQSDMAKNFPSPFLLCFLGNELKVDTLVIDRSWQEAHRDQMEAFPELSKIAYDDEDVVIIEIGPSQETCPPLTAPLP